jgi:Uma2 family endonuclease
MSVSTPPDVQSEIIYPHTDDQPMAENTLQYEWIVTLKEGVERTVRDRPVAFVAGDLFWYPVEGHPEIVQAPDVLVAIGRPRGHRLSYKQWEEGGVAPQVVFEVLSPSNRPTAMGEKLKFYERYGVDEYYIYDPDEVELTGYLRGQGRLQPITDMDGWTSPLLGIRFDMSGPELMVYGPDGERFQTYQELAEQRDQLAEQRDQLAEQRDQLARELEAERQRIERLTARLRALGLEPPE